MRLPSGEIFGSRTETGTGAGSEGPGEAAPTAAASSIAIISEVPRDGSFPHAFRILTALVEDHVWDLAFVVGEKLDLRVDRREEKPGLRFREEREFRLIRGL